MEVQASPLHNTPNHDSKLKDTTAHTEKPTSIDLWNVPALVNPSPPSNTLLITNLQTPHIFSAAALQHLYSLLNEPVPLNSFAPLPSLRRIIISYPTIEAAVATRQLLEQSSSLPTPPHEEEDVKNTTTTTASEQQQQHHEDATTKRRDIRPMKIYFGEPTPLVGQYASDSTTASAHLQAPSLGKLMFISPPPSPPCGWEIRDEDPPNKTTHAEDLLAALSGLSGGRSGSIDRNDSNDIHDNHNHNHNNNTTNPTSAPENDTANANIPTATEAETGGSSPGQGQGSDTRRKRRSTLTVYHPRDHGDSEDLPAVMVEDTTGGPDDGGEEEDGEDDDEVLREREGGAGGGGGAGSGGPLPTRTARPPVELMMDAT